MTDAGRDLVEADLDRFVAGLDKKRHEIRAGRIRAAQGHPVDVELGFEPKVLYHGTVSRFLDAIRTEGLRPGDRTQVHLSEGESTALQVGQRRGAPLVLDRGIFRIPEWPSSVNDSLVRWVLWSKRRAVVSHDSAAAAHGLGVLNPAKVHLTLRRGFAWTILLLCSTGVRSLMQT